MRYQACSSREQISGTPYSYGKFASDRDIRQSTNDSSDIRGMVGSIDNIVGGQGQFQVSFEVFLSLSFSFSLVIVLLSHYLMHIYLLLLYFF